MEDSLVLEELGLEEMSLLDGERLDSTLNLDGDGSGSSPGGEMVLLTDRRVIHARNGRRRKAVIASIQDIDAIEISQEQQGAGAFLWAGLAFLVAIILYLMIDAALTRTVAAAVVAVMGIYLLVDQLLLPGKPLVIFRAGGVQLEIALKSQEVPPDVYAFVNRVFELKDDNGPNGVFARVQRFAPR